MADPIALLPPQRLYAMLRACSSSEARAAAVLSFVRGSTGSPGGFLFMARGDELVVAARSQPGDPPTGLVDEASRVWKLAPDPQADISKTLDRNELTKLDRTQESPIWSSSNAEVFERRVLATHRRTRWVLAGVLMLKAGARDSLLPIRHAHVEALCNALIDTGDVADSEAE